MKFTNKVTNKVCWLKIGKTKIKVEVEIVCGAFNQNTWCLVKRWKKKSVKLVAEKVVLGFQTVLS
jgi:hypothetical protein